MDERNRPERRVRHAVQLEASVTRSNGAVVPCTVSDFSLDGCCLCGCGFFTVGERIEIAVRPIGVLSAEIRWAAMGRAGARFIGRSSRAA